MERASGYQPRPSIPLLARPFLTCRRNSEAARSGSSADWTKSPTQYARDDAPQEPFPCPNRSLQPSHLCDHGEMGPRLELWRPVFKNFPIFHPSGLISRIWHFGSCCFSCSKPRVLEEGTSQLPAEDMSPRFTIAATCAAMPPSCLAVRASSLLLEH